MRFHPRILWLILLVAALGMQAAPAQEPKVHVVQPGETLYSLSRQYDVPIERLRALNGLADNTIQIGQKLVVGRAEAAVPVKNASAPAERPREAQQAAGADTYVVQPGETLYTIADRLGVTAYLLYTLNEGLRSPLEAGQVIRVPIDAVTGTYAVRSGDTLYRVARQHGTTVETLQRMNDLESTAIRIGQVLRVPAQAPSAAPKTTAAASDGSAGRPDLQRGPVTIYPGTFTGRLTASGDRYDPSRFTVSHPSLPLGTTVLLTNLETGRSTFAEVTDRGPIDTSYVMDVSEAVAQQIELDERRRPQVQIQVVE